MKSNASTVIVFESLKMHYSVSSYRVLYVRVRYVPGTFIPCSFKNVFIFILAQMFTSHMNRAEGIQLSRFASVEPVLNLIGLFLDPQHRDSWTVASKSWFTLLKERTWYYISWRVTVIG